MLSKPETHFLGFSASPSGKPLAIATGGLFCTGVVEIEELGQVMLQGTIESHDRAGFDPDVMMGPII